MSTKKYPILALSFFLLLNLSACTTTEQAVSQQSSNQQIGNQQIGNGQPNGSLVNEPGAVTPLNRAGNYKAQSGQYQISQQPYQAQSGQWQPTIRQDGQYQTLTQGQSYQLTPPAGQVYEAEVLRAQAAQAIKVMVTATLPVKKQLPDDLKGLKHEKFLLSLSNGTTILVAHNIDQAAYVPIKPGDLVTIHGEYIWNAKGGLIHWTHRSDTPRHESGWIELNGQRYD